MIDLTKIPKGAKPIEQMEGWPTYINPSLFQDVSFYRNPKWLVGLPEYPQGAGVLWNPYTGFTLRDELFNKLREWSRKGMEVTPELLMETFPKRIGANPYKYWSQYSGRGQNTNTNYPTSIPPWQIQPFLPATTDTTLPTGGDQSFQFNYPWQWDMASDIYSQLAGGVTIPTPWQWTYGSNILRGIAKTGLPVSQEEWYKKAMQVSDIAIADQIANAAERAGLTGLRWSTPMGRTAQDIAGRITAETGLEREARELAALEAARQRQLAALGQLYTYGQGQAGLSQAALQAQLQALSGLTGLGGMYAQLPLSVSDALMRQALMQQQLEMNQMYPPWMQGMLGLLGSQPGYAPQMYQPSFMTQLLGIVPSILPWVLGGQGQNNPFMYMASPTHGSPWGYQYG